MSTGPEWAAIFDWDGVILDSSRQHEESWALLAREEGLPLPADFFRRSLGMKYEQIIPELLGWTRDPERVRQLGDRKEALYRELIRRDGVQPLPGAREWLETLRVAGIPCAVGSSTPRANLDCVMDALGLREFFRAIVAAEDVARGKPHPEVFLRAAERLGMPPSRCVVFEDAQVGLQAARAAGMKVVGVATTHPAASLAGADCVVRRLDELRPEQIAAWFNAAS